MAVGSIGGGFTAVGAAAEGLTAVGSTGSSGFDRGGLDRGSDSTAIDSTAATSATTGSAATGSGRAGAAGATAASGAVGLGTVGSGRAASEVSGLAASATTGSGEIVSAGGAASGSAASSSPGTTQSRFFRGNGTPGSRCDPIRIRDFRSVDAASSGCSRASGVSGMSVRSLVSGVESPLISRSLGRRSSSCSGVGPCSEPSILRTRRSLSKSSAGSSSGWAAQLPAHHLNEG